MSFMSGRLSTSVPTSAGVIPAGGSYCTATGSFFGSLPCRRHRLNIRPNTPTGMTSGRLASRKLDALLAAVGRATTPGFHAMATVMPSRKLRTRVVSTVMLVPTIVVVAAVSCDP